MTKAFILAAAAVAVTAGIAQAGPCEAQIGATQKRIDAWLEANAKRGPVGPQSTAAQLHRQPTPQSLAAAEEKLKEIPPATVNTLNAAMARARAADGAGDLPECRKALDEAQKLIGP